MSSLRYRDLVRRDFCIFNCYRSNYLSELQVSALFCLSALFRNCLDSAINGKKSGQRRRQKTNANFSKSLAEQNAVEARGAGKKPSGRCRESSLRQRQRVTIRSGCPAHADDAPPSPTLSLFLSGCSRITSPERIRPWRAARLLALVSSSNLKGICIDFIK